MHATVRNLVLFVFFTLIVQFKTPPAWGFAFSPGTLQRASDLARQEKIWFDPQWLRLGHYEKKTFGDYKSDFRGALFIHPQGYASPEDELFKTLEAFFSDSAELTAKYKRHPQCQFLARRKWLFHRLQIPAEEIIPCDERVAWKAQLNVKSVSLIFAASDIGNPASSFGHTFIKLVNPENSKNKDLIDYGVNYAARADESEGLFYALKGLMGMYGGVFTMLPYHQKIREYINIEGRDIWEYPLTFTPDEVDDLVDHLLELENTEAPYYFFTKNCSYHILRTLEVVRPELSLGNVLSAFVIPIDTVKVIKRHSSLIGGRVFKKSLKTDYQESYSRLGSLQKKALDEAVEKLSISNTYELTPEAKAEVFETAMKYMAIKAYRTGEDLDEQVYKLSSERATLGNLTEDQGVRNQQPPEESHDSSAIYVGRGKENRLDYYALKFRSAFHDLEQPDFGAVHMSQTELASVELRYFTETKKTSLARLTLMNLINTNPVTQLNRNLSWKIRGLLTDPWHPDAEGGAGYSFDYPFGTATRVATFLTGRYWQSESDSYLGAGPELLFITRPTPKIGFSAGLTYFGLVNKRPFFRVKSKLNYNLRPNDDLQMEFESLLNDQTDFQIKILKNFLF